MCWRRYSEVQAETDSVSLLGARDEASIIGTDVAVFIPAASGTSKKERKGKAQAMLPPSSEFARLSLKRCQTRLTLHISPPYRYLEHSECP